MANKNRRSDLFGLLLCALGVLAILVAGAF